MLYFVKVRNLKKPEHLEKYKKMENAPDIPQDDIGFMIWKAELSKELLQFWKKMK